MFGDGATTPASEGGRYKGSEEPRAGRMPALRKSGYFLLKMIYKQVQIKVRLACPEELRGVILFFVR
jgi:hypothetical protein